MQSNEFSGFNLNLLPGGRANSFKKGVKLGASGVSTMQGFTPDYNRPGYVPLQGGAGVSQVSRPPAAARPLEVKDYSMYDKGPGVNVNSRLYGPASNPKSVDAMTSLLTR